MCCAVPVPLSACCCLNTTAVLRSFSPKKKLKEKKINREEETNIGGYREPVFMICTDKQRWDKSVCVCVCVCMYVGERECECDKG